MRRSDREPSRSHAPDNTLLFDAVFDHTDLMLRTPISAGGTNTDVHTPSPTCKIEDPWPAVPSVQADPQARTPGLRADSLSESMATLAEDTCVLPNRAKCSSGVGKMGHAREPNKARRCLTAAETTVRP
jgi:hypothetical protein